MLKLKLQYFGHLIQRADSLESASEIHWLIGKDPDAGKDWGPEEKGVTEDEMVGWHHQLHGHGFGWTTGVGDGQGGLGCCSSWGHKESDTTERLNWTKLIPMTALLGASLAAQMVKNPPAMKETLIRFLGWKDSLEKGMAAHSSILCLENSCSTNGGAWWAIVHGVAKSRTWLSD